MHFKNIYRYINISQFFAFDINNLFLFLPLFLLTNSARSLLNMPFFLSPHHSHILQMCFIYSDFVSFQYERYTINHYYYHYYAFVALYSSLLFSLSFLHPMQSSSLLSLFPFCYRTFFVAPRIFLVHRVGYFWNLQPYFSFLLPSIFLCSLPQPQTSQRKFFFLSIYTKYTCIVREFAAI